MGFSMVCPLLAQRRQLVECHSQSYVLTVLVPLFFTLGELPHLIAQRCCFPFCC